MWGKTSATASMFTGWTHVSTGGRAAHLLRQVRESLQHTPVLLDAIDASVGAAHCQVQPCGGCVTAGRLQDYSPRLQPEAVAISAN
jgi:hypothetical protein